MSKTTEMNRELNQAIWTVLNTKFKKDAKEAFKAVEDAGYTVCKNGSGHWVVSNKQNRRFVYLAERGQGRWTRTVIQHGHYTNQSRGLTDKEAWAKTSPFDFVGCLEKPVNEIWYHMDDSNKVTARSKYENISFNRRMVKSYKNDIERTQKQIAELQKSLIRQTELKMTYEMKVEELRKEYGLA